MKELLFCFGGITAVFALMVLTIASIQGKKQAQTILGWVLGVGMLLTLGYIIV